MHSQQQTRVAPLGSTGSPPSCTVFFASSVSHVWRQLIVPVEWRGAYSVDKLLGLLAYNSSRIRVWLVLALTPLPALVACLLIEFLLPLNDPACGLRGNTAFLARTWVRCSLTSFAIDSFIELYIPFIRLPKLRLLLMNIVQGFVGSAAIVAVSKATGVFPIPFTPAATTPVYAIFSWLLRFLCDTPSRQRDPDPVATRRATERVMKTINFSVLLSYIYCGFVTLLAFTPTRWQAPMALTLVGIKSLTTRGDWRRAQQLLVSGQNDLAAAHVAFDAQYYHALFVAVCLQKSSSYEMLATVVALSIVYQFTTVHELQRHIQHVARLSTQLDPSGRVAANQRLREIALRQQQHRSGLDPKLETVTAAAPFLAATWFGRQTTIESDSLTTKPFEPLASTEREYLEAATALYQCREATLLRLYVDIFVPVVFYVFVATIKFLPNGEFLPFLHTNDLGELAVRLGVQLSVKLVAFGLLLHMLHHEDASGPSGLWQLAFALERMAVVVQTRSIIVSLWVFDFPLLHNGNDLTFQFAWLRGRPDANGCGP